MAINSLINDLVMLTSISSTGVTPNTTKFYDLMSRDQQSSSPSSVLAMADIVSPVFADCIVAAEQKNEFRSDLNSINALHSEHIHELDILQYQLGLPQENMVPDLSENVFGLAMELISHIGNMSQVEHEIPMSLVLNAVVKPSGVTDCDNDRVDVAMLSIATGQLAYGFYSQCSVGFSEVSEENIAHQSNDIKLSKPVADYSFSPNSITGSDVSSLHFIQIQPGAVSFHASQANATNDDYSIDRIKATQSVAHYLINKLLPRKLTLISSGESAALYIRDYYSSDNATECYAPYAQQNISSINVERVVVNGVLIKDSRTV